MVYSADVFSVDSVDELWTLTNIDLQRTGGSKAERADVLKKLEPQELQQFFMALIGTLMFVDFVA